MDYPDKSVQGGLTGEPWVWGEDPSKVDETGGFTKKVRENTDRFLVYVWGARIKLGGENARF